MESFKLLTKGSKFSKNNPIPSSRLVPSAGPAKDPRVLIDEPSNDLVIAQTNSRKRKRPGSAGLDKISEQALAQAPDFFGSNVPEQTQTQSAGVTRTTQTVTSETNIQEIPFQRFSEDECKRILKKHKLKVTLMNPPKSKKDASKTKKQNLIQLVPQPLVNFADLGPRFKLSRRLATNILEQGYSSPTEVQLAAIPILLGDNEDRGLSGSSKSKGSLDSTVDLISIAPTGSGKTLAFLIPVIQGLLDLKHQTPDDGENSASYVKAIVLAPTHELADQIVNEARKLVQGTGIRVAGMKKGMHIMSSKTEADSTQNSEASLKVDLLVSTPLVLLNSISEAFPETQSIPSAQFLILDEADVLLDPLFREQTLSIWTACNNQFLKVSLWSATIGASIEHLAQDFIAKRRKELGLSRKHHRILRLIAGLKDSALPTVSHRLIYAATEQGKLLAIRQILRPSATTAEANLRPPFLIFTQTIPRASALHSELLYDIPFEAGGSSRIAVLHSSLSDTARSDIMTRFRKGEIWILITTDLLSRGVDFRGVNGVVNYDIPTTSASYVHRAGRTGRAGREGGVSITLYTKEDIPYVKNVANVIAASERVHGKKSNSENGEGVPKWLLDALPDVSKKTKKELKKRGVAERRTDSQSRAAKISTKSGFQRREDNRKKGAILANRTRSLAIENEDNAGDESEWAGLDD